MTHPETCSTEAIVLELLDALRAGDVARMEQIKAALSPAERAAVGDVLAGELTRRLLVEIECEGGEQR